MAFDDDAVRQFLHENLPYEDIRPNRYDELMRRSSVSFFTDAIAQAIDETFGQDVADAHANLSEVNQLATLLADRLISEDVWKQIRSRVKKREDL